MVLNFLKKKNITVENSIKNKGEKIIYDRSKVKEL